MKRVLGLCLVLASLLVLGLSGCGGGNKDAARSVLLVLPASAEPPSHSPERVTQLTVDGKDVPVKPGEAVELPVTIAAPSKETVTIVFSYWPKSYSNTIRTKEVRLDKDQAVRVDFNVRDEQHTDMIKPIYFPTPTAVVEEMCRMGKVGKDDVVYDIGCGDGRLVNIAVKKFGAKKGVGVEIDADLVKLCEENAKKEGVADRVEFRNEDALKMKDLSDATVVLLYVGEDFGRELEPVLRKTLKPGARVVSHRFPLGSWKADETKDINAKNNYDKDEDYHLLLWTIK